jgi:hypothetical protein
MPCPPPKSHHLAAPLVALAVGLLACSVVVNSALDDKTAAEGGAGGSGGTTADGGGGTDPGTGIRCGPELLCVNGRRCCVGVGDPSAVQCADDCPPGDIPIYCATADDCPETEVCCAQYSVSTAPQLQNVACVVTCSPLEGGFLVCTDHPGMCAAPTSCQGSVQLPEGTLICNL